ncbi:CotH kinase family protein [Limosilactobacillus pontis]|uniref:CotH kinase family protein n=1 Tax=Limosilactobacillus pontis TaxID=35787 RepID=UPI002F261B03
MRVTIDLMKKSTQIIDLSNVINPRVGDDDLQLPLHIGYGDTLVDMRGKDVEFLSQDTNKNNIYIAGTVNTNTPGDNLFMGDLTFRFPAGTFKTDGTYDPDKTMFRIVDKDTQKVISSVNVKITVMKNNLEFNFDPDKTSYDSRLETMLHDFHDKGQSMLDDIKNLNDQAKSNVSGDTAATAKEAKQQADANAGDISDVKGEIAGARGRFTNMADREDAQDAAINQKENIANANANYALLQQKDAQQDAIIANKAGKFELEAKLAQMDIHPEVFENLAALQAKYPNGAPGMMVTADNEHKYVYLNNQWEDKGQFVFNDLNPQDKKMLYARSSDNILTNPDLKDNAAGWQVAGNWDMDPAHAIGNSMAYGVNLSDNTSSFSQENINFKGQHFASAGVQVLTVGIPSGINFQLLFKDANGQVINNAVYNVPIPTDTDNSFKLVSVEHVTVPNTAMTAAVTVAGKGKGLLIICRPQLNFTSTLVPYSILEMDQNKDQGQDNILTNPDLRRDAYGWEITGPWQADIPHSIGNSMAYGLNLTEDQTTSSSFFQENINVKGRVAASAGVHVLTVNAGPANMQLLFKDETGQIIDGAVYNIALPTDTDNHFQIVKIEGVNVPANAETAALTVATKSKGLYIICRPQLNCQTTLVPYSTQEIDQVSRTYRQSSDNALINPDLKHYADGWTFFGPWQVDPAHAIGNSMAYGLNVTDKPASTCSFYQENIDVEKRGIASAGIRVMTVNASGASFQLLFKDKDDQIITTDVYNQALPSNTNNVFDTLSFTEIKVPDNAKTAALTVATSNTGLIIICRPQLNFADHLVPYSFSDVDTSKAKHLLPYFNFGTGAANVQNDWVNTSFSYIEDDHEIDGYAQIAIQGDSSRTYPKKNYKIKLFSDADCKQKLKLRLVPSWPETNKFNLKANWIDATQSRNLASAKLVAAATAVTPIADSTVDSHLAKTSNFGQMEGFPIEIYFNGAYNGLYTCNTKKDDKVFGLDADQAGNAAISILDDVAQSDTQLLSVPTAKLDGVAYADELHDTPDPELVANWTKWLQFLNTATDDDFKANLGNYIDVKSAINLYLFGVMSREYDYNTKSVLYLTWNNGKYFYLIPYDLDSNWGQSADGKIEGNPTNDGWAFSTDNGGQDGKSVSNLNWNKLFERLYKLFMPEIKEQYTYLRSNVWRTDQLLNAYRDFMNQIPQSVYEKDHALWKQIPSLETNDYEQLHQVIVQRSNQMDRWIKSK